MTSQWSLKGRVVLISGASSGIGEHLATCFAGAGAMVVLGARRSGRTAALAKHIVESGGHAISVDLDVTVEDSVIAAFDEAEAALGPIDTIVANAGISYAGRSTDLDAHQISQVFETNLLGVYLTVREGGRRMIAAGSRESARGRVLLMGSVTADMVGQGDAAYAASKAGVAHLGRQFAREWVRQGINVNTLQPGYIRTELAGGWFESEGGKAQIAAWNRRRMMDIDSLDDLALYLCSDASRYVTGATLTIDDGQSL